MSSPSLLPAPTANPDPKLISHRFDRLSILSKVEGPMGVSPLESWSITPQGGRRGSSPLWSTPRLNPRGRYIDQFIINLIYDGTRRCRSLGPSPSERGQWVCTLVASDPRYARNFKFQIDNLKSKFCIPEGGVPTLLRNRPSVA